MKFKIFLGFLFMIISLISPLYATVDLSVDDCFFQEYFDKTVELGRDINVDIDFFIGGMDQAGLNRAVIFQVGNLNNAYQYQHGTSDIAVIYQEGFQNSASQEQNGDHNQAYLIQNGANNRASQHQYNDYNTGIIVQIGYNNEASQYQYGRSTSIIIQQGNGWRITTGF